MYISYLTDEAHENFAEALRLGASWGLRHAEVRTVDGVNAVDLTDAQVKRAKKLLDEHGMRVSAIATPFFKCDIPGIQSGATGPMHGARELSYEDHLAQLRRGVQLAQAFETPYIRIFSFWYQAGVDFWPALNEAVDRALDAARGTGVTVCLENEGACSIRTGADLRIAKQRLDSRLKFIWDPGNSTYQGMPPREDDFAELADRVALVHLKDARYDAAQGKRIATAVGDGETHYAAELPRIAARYDGALTLEPHYRPGGSGAEGVRESLDAVRALAAAAGITLD